MKQLPSGCQKGTLSPFGECYGLITKNPFLSQTTNRVSALKEQFLKLQNSALFTHSRVVLNLF